MYTEIFNKFCRELPYLPEAKYHREYEINYLDFLHSAIRMSYRLDEIILLSILLACKHLQMSFLYSYTQKTHHL